MNMSEKNLLLIALSTAMRFPSARGLITTEDLFGMPLTATNGFSLDAVAKSVNSALKSLGEESFVNRGDTAQQNGLNEMLNVVKLVIDFRQEQNAVALAKREKRARRAKLLEALENRENTELASMSKEDILKQLEELD
jgi:hypothetical protein